MRCVVCVYSGVSIDGLSSAMGLSSATDAHIVPRFSRVVPCLDINLLPAQSQEASQSPGSTIRIRREHSPLSIRSLARSTHPMAKRRGLVANANRDGNLKPNVTTADKKVPLNLNKNDKKTRSESSHELSLFLARFPQPEKKAGDGYVDCGGVV
ncbi:hypothetical protein CC2G_001937 [Coprinopsis cinerea AmutBmut pab1-1]|nr:hypothetical protein CC2G_001937 [Coprinopsis cinerea AmutBmut pab1-1]